MATKATARQAKYDKANTRFYGIKLNNKTDADVIEKLASVPSMQGYIKQLIREDIARTCSGSVPVTPFGVPDDNVDDETRKAIEKELIRWLQWYKNQYGVDSIFI